MSHVQETREFSEAALPKRETECPVCSQLWEFETDREGCLVQSCGCGVHFTPVKLGTLDGRRYAAHRDNG